MRKYTSETIIITKEAWVFIGNWDRTRLGHKPMNDKFIEHMWTQAFRNGGANQATHPISDNEIRVDCDSFMARLADVKEHLQNNGYTYRQDGFITEGFTF